MGVSLKGHEALLVASRGVTTGHGLYRWVERDGRWTGTQLATVPQLSALAAHPTLPVVYGTSISDEVGAIHAWRLEGDKATSLGAASSGGVEPCHAAIDPDGRRLVVSNYLSSTLGVQTLAPDGSLAGPVERVALAGSGPETDRQDAAHPHQALFHDGRLFVVDLGADLLREFAVDPNGRGAAALTPVRASMLPAGAGPRHAAILPDGRFALSGELGGNLLVGRPGDPPPAWANVPSTMRTGPARTRSRRNYPGDIQCSPDGRYVHVANRGHDTIATFDVSGAMPVLVSERESTVEWPQHLLVHEDWLLVAGWDSSRVVAMPLTGGRPGPAEPVFDCPGAGWLLIQNSG